MTIVTLLVGTALAAPESLVSWWPGEGDATDLAGLNDGTPMGGVVFAPGHVGQAFGFAASGDAIAIPDDPSLDPGTDDFSLEGWVRADGDTDSVGWVIQLIQSKLHSGTGGYRTATVAARRPVARAWACWRCSPPSDSAAASAPAPG